MIDINWRDFRTKLSDPTPAEILGLVAILITMIVVAVVVGIVLVTEPKLIHLLIRSLQS